MQSITVSDNTYNLMYTNILFANIHMCALYTIHVYSGVLVPVWPNPDGVTGTPIWDWPTEQISLAVAANPPIAEEPIPDPRVAGGVAAKRARNQELYQGITWLEFRIMTGFRIPGLYINPRYGIYWARHCPLYNFGNQGNNLGFPNMTEIHRHISVSSQLVFLLYTVRI